eukprot:COSAG03_NODE_4843_length_1414_cov_1.055513_3_plen_108_part_00
MVCHGRKAEPRVEVSAPAVLPGTGISFFFKKMNQEYTAGEYIVLNKTTVDDRPFKCTLHSSTVVSFTDTSGGQATRRRTGPPSSARLSLALSEFSHLTARTAQSRSE